MVIRRIAPALLLVAIGATPSPTPAPTPQNAADVLGRVDASWRTMESYEVPVKITGKVRVSLFAVPVAMDGTQYYKAPGKETMRLNNVPSMAKSFSNTVASMGSPETWEQTYAFVLNGTQQHGKHAAYVLVGTPKRPGANVKTETLWVNEQTFVVESVAFAYNNGSWLKLDFSRHGLSPHHLPTSIAVDAKFPGYTGQAQILYGTYQINVPIADSEFTQQ